MLRAVLREITPPIVKRFFSRSDEYEGDFKSFDEAVTAAGGTYDNPGILETTRNWTLPSGEHVSQSSMRLLAAFQRVPGPIRVLDFGGALGTHFFHLSPFLNIETWTVCELPETAAAGAPCGALRFTSRLEGEAPNVVLASGSLQYTADPYAEISRLCSLGSDFFIVDKLPLLKRQRLTVQNAPSLGCKFPCWLLCRERFFSSFAGWNVAMRWELPECPDVDAKFEGALFTRS